MNPLIVYQAPWNWDFLWNRSQPLAQALSSYADVLYINASAYRPRMLARTLRRIPKVRGAYAILCRRGMRKVHTATLSVYGWTGVWDGDMQVYTSDRPASSYDALRKEISRIGRTRKLWLITSRPNAAQLIDLMPWDRIAVDIEDPWMELSWSDSISDEAIRRLARANVVFGNGANIASKYSKIMSRTVINMPNGIDSSFVQKIEIYSSDSADYFEKHDKTRVVFTGNINDRLDYHGLLRLTEKMRGICFAFIGAVNVPVEIEGQFRQLMKMPNVQYYPAVSHAEVPKILASADMLMIPYTRAGSANMFPAKLYEYTAASKPILTTSDFGMGAELPESARVYTSIDEFEYGVSDYESGKWRVTEDVRNACLDVARQNTWDGRAADIMKYMLESVQHAR